MASELGKPPADPASLLAPTEDEWRAMTPAERERRVLQIVDALQEARANDARARVEQAEAEVERMLDWLPEDIVALLSARGIPCPDAARARVQECRDAAELRRWLRAAMTAATAEEIFGPG